MYFAKHVKWRSEKFGAVIFDTLNEKVYVTNETGNEILRLITDGLDTCAIAERLEEKYPGDPSQLQSDVAAFAGDLQSIGLLTGSTEEQR